MVDNNLAKMTDQALLKLFVIRGANNNTPRTQQIRAELERRGYHFDPTHQDFLTCQQWNDRYPEAHRNCEAEARRRQHGAG